MTNLSERIRAIAPGNAVHYRLRMQRYDGSTLIYPSDEAAYFDIGEAPSPVPAGTYVITFYDRELRLIAHPHQTFVINPHSEMTKSPQAQLSLNFQTAGARPAPPHGGSPASPSGAGASSSSAAAALPPKHLESGSEEDLEFRKQLAALDLEERQQEFIKNSTYIKELGEAFVLNRLMRREMIEMQRSVAHQAKQAFLDLGNSKATIQRLLELQDSVLDHVEKHRYVPPAPPPDYVGLGHAAIGMLKEVGVALIQRYGGERAGLAPAASSPPPPQLPAAGSAAAPAAAATAASTPAPAADPRPPDVIDRIGQKLRTLTELDLAKAMSAPESWAGLLQDCLQPGSPTEMKAPGRAEENGGDGSDLASGAGPV